VCGAASELMHYVKGQSGHGYASPASAAKLTCSNAVGSSDSGGHGADTQIQMRQVGAGVATFCHMYAICMDICSVDGGTSGQVQQQHVVGLSCTKCSKANMFKCGWQLCRWRA
jgi:hypothetical protein